MAEEKIRRFLKAFAEELDKQEYKERLSLGKWPIWWFFESNFLRDNLPSAFPCHKELIRKLTGTKESEKSGGGIIHRMIQKAKYYSLRKTLFFSLLAKIAFIKIFYSNTKYAEPAENIHSNTDKKDKIMFACYTNGIILKDNNLHIDRLNTLFTALKNDNALSPFIVSVDPLSKKDFFSLLKFPNIAYSFMNIKMILSAYKNARKINRAWENISRNKRIINWITARTATTPTKKGQEACRTEFRDIYSAYKPVLDFYFSAETIFAIALYYSVYKKIIGEKKIKFVILPVVAGMIDRACIAASDDLNIKSMIIMHGMGIHDFGFKLPHSVMLAAPGSYFRDNYREVGIAKKNILVAGALFLENIHEYIKQNKPGKNIKNSRQRKYGLLFLTQPFVESTISTKEYYFGIIKKIFCEFKKMEEKGRFDFVVKIHPNEKFDGTYHKLAEEAGLKKIKFYKLGTKADLFNLINDSDIVLGFGSTATSEALILGKPVMLLFINTMGGVFTPIITDKDSGIRLRDISELEKKSCRVLTNKKFFLKTEKSRKRFVKKYYGNIDGRCHERIIRQIRKIIQ